MSDQQVTQPAEPSNNLKALACLQFIHNKLAISQFFPEEFSQVHSALKFIEDLSLQLEAAEMAAQASNIPPQVTEGHQLNV